jgi:hypothetical protein
MRGRKWEAAIPHFESSYAFFSAHQWIDRFRSVILMSPSAASYREMALVNVAFCYSQLGHGTEAKSVYERALREFPGSPVASSALKLIESAESAGS